MKGIVIFIFSILCFISCIGQTVDRKTYCGSDTLQVERVNVLKGRFDVYSAISCKKVGNLGLRLEFGISYFSYNRAVANWLGHHGAMSFGIIVPYQNWHIGLRAKTWTINPSSDIITGVDTLLKSIKINPNKMDYFVGYGFCLRNRLFLEPYLGYSGSSFYVHQESMARKQFHLP